MRHNNNHDKNHDKKPTTNRRRILQADGKTAA